MVERGLVVSDPHWKDIVKEEKRHCAHIKKTFQGQVLGYVTPVSLICSQQYVSADVQHVTILLQSRNLFRLLFIQKKIRSSLSINKKPIKITNSQNNDPVLPSLTLV